MTDHSQQQHHQRPQCCHSLNYHYLICDPSQERTDSTVYKLLFLPCSFQCQREKLRIPNTESSITTPVVVNICWPEVKRTDLCLFTRLELRTIIMPSSTNPLPSLCLVGRAIRWKRVESNLSFFSIDGHRAISLVPAPRNTTVVQHTIGPYWYRLAPFKMVPQGKSLMGMLLESCYDLDG